MVVSKPEAVRSRGHRSLRPQKTAMLLAQRIVSEVSDNGLAPGTQLPPEREMLFTYGVARGTLREALRVLEIQGVITIKTGPGGGAAVASPMSRHLASVVAMRLQLSHTPFSAVLEARSVLEPAMARQAAERINAEGVERLQMSTLRMEAQLDGVEAFLAENETFHTLVAEAAGNELFSLFIGSLNWICDASPLGVEYPRVMLEKVLADHVAICKAIADGDVERAGETMARHVSDFAKHLKRKYPHVVDAALRWDQVDP